jgi:hypothetical protein
MMTQGPTGTRRRRFICVASHPRSRPTVRGRASRGTDVLSTAGDDIVEERLGFLRRWIVERHQTESRGEGRAGARAT